MSSYLKATWRRILLRSILFCSTASILICGSAFAADLPNKKAPPVYAPPAFTWTGFYVGAHAGAVWSNVTVTDVNAFASRAQPGTKTNLKGSGFIGGVQAGYNWQSGILVFGVEGDLGYLGLNKKGLLTDTNSNTMVGSNAGLYGDITGRLGAVVNNNVLVYAKSGGALFNGSRSFSTLASFTAGNVGTYYGWTAGAGIEWAFMSNWTAKIEYQHFDFGKKSYALTPPDFNFNEKLRADAITVGVNYKF